MTTETIGIGSTLYLYDDRYRPREGSPLERERTCYRPHVITGETRGKWLADDGFGEYEINKRTLLMSGADRRYGPRQFYTAAQVEDRLWDSTYRRAIVRLIERASVDQLRAVAAAVGYEVGE
jgi:hypothetical protein